VGAEVDEEDSGGAREKINEQVKSDLGTRLFKFRKILLPKSDFAHLRDAQH